MNLGNLDFKVGSINPTGIGTTIYRIAKDLIKSWPTIGNDLSGEGNISTMAAYSGDFVLAENAVWDKIYSTQGKGSASYETTGEVDCKMFINKASISYPKLTDEAKAFSKVAVNGDFVYILKHDGKYVVIGSEDYRVTTTPSGTTGTEAGSAKGVTIEIQAHDVTPMPTYTGKLVLADGTLDCGTGTFSPAS